MDGTATGELGEVLIRCNNILYVRQLVPDEPEEEGEVEME